MKNFSLKNIALGGIVFIALSATAQPARVSLDLGAVKLANIEIKGRIQTWSMTKVCIEGQAYLLIDGVSGPNGISPSFKDGKPEQCVLDKAKP